MMVTFLGYRAKEVRMKFRLGYLFVALLLFSFPSLARNDEPGIEPIPDLTVQPLPLPGGDIIPGYGLFNQFFPGTLNPPYDPVNSDPHGITNFRGVTAMGYTGGMAVDSSGKKYVVVTDIRVYRGEYVGAEVADPNSAGATKSAHAHGTFVEI